jgi:uncharacterized protein (DUF1330 family)
MSVYWIGRAQARDPEGYREYGLRVAAAAKAHPYDALVRGGAYKILEGEDEFNRFAVLRFEDMQAALRYYNSPEYQAAAAIRRAASGRCELALVQGLQD